MWKARLPISCNISKSRHVFCIVDVKPRPKCRFYNFSKMWNCMQCTRLFVNTSNFTQFRDDSLSQVMLRNQSACDVPIPNLKNRGSLGEKRGEVCLSSFLKVQFTKKKCGFFFVADLVKNTSIDLWQAE